MGLVMVDAQAARIFEIREFPWREKTIFDVFANGKWLMGYWSRAEAEGRIEREKQHG